MNKVIRTLLPIFLALVIILCTAWYLLVYDRQFTIDVMLSCARHSELQGQHEAAAWFYNLAYRQADDGDSIAIELANQYLASGNYTKAEYTLVNAIEDGGGIDVYIALSKTYVEQDKLLDAVALLNQVTDNEVKQALDSMRPAAPTVTPDPGLFREYIQVTVASGTSSLYVTGDGTYPSISNPTSNHTLTLTDGVNTISAVAVAENGLVSPLASFEFTVGGVIKEVVFADAAIEQEVRKILSLNDDKPVFTNQIWTITDFVMPNDATTYADLQYFTYLKRLVIKNGLISQMSNLEDLVDLNELVVSDTVMSAEDLKTIGSLPGLEKLTLDNCNLSNIEPLTSATNLVYLDLSNNVIRNINPLRNMTELTELYLQHNSVVDLAPLSGLAKLTKLSVSSNALTSLSSVGALAELTELDASTNAITDLGDISSLTKLESLNLSRNQLTDISALGSCTALVKLIVGNNALTSVDCIASLTELMHIDFSFNKVEKLPKFTDSALISVNGANNLLANIDNLASLKHINAINMDYNEELSSISALADCGKLIEVSVYGTKVTDVKVLTESGIVVNYNPVQ